jgi:hypothetical protein
MKRVALKKIKYLLTYFMLMNFFSVQSQNLDLLSKKCPSNWAFFIGEIHHVKEIRNHLYKLLVENTNTKKSTVLFIEYSRSYNYRIQKYFETGKQEDLHKVVELLISSKASSEYKADSIRSDFESLFRNINALNQQNKKAKIAIECIDKELNDSITLTVLSEKFNINTKPDAVATIFDSVFYYKKILFGKINYIKSLIAYCSLNKVIIESKYGQEGFTQLSRCFNELSLAIYPNEIFSKKSVRDSIMCANFIEISKKYENYNFILQFGSVHVFGGSDVYKYVTPKKNFYKRVQALASSNNLCLTNSVYFCKKNMPVNPTHITKNHAEFLKQFKSGEMIENKDYPELKELSTHYDYTIILEEATLMFKDYNGRKE